MEQWLPFIQEVSFLIIVTLYLLHRIETKLDAVIDSIQKLPVQGMDGAYIAKKKI
jgi:hypothetical protein